VRKLLAVSCLLVLAACGGGGSASEPEVVTVATAAVASSSPTLPVSAPGYTMQGPIFNGAGVVEAQFYPFAGSYGLYFGCADERTCFIPNFPATPQQSAGRRAVPNTCRFAYAFYDKGHFLLCIDTWDSNLYLWRSHDTVTWWIENGGQAILKRQPGTNWAHVWNVAILPVNGRWHMLAETSATTDRMDISYAWIDPWKGLDFTPNLGPVVIPNGGNPEMFLKNGKMVAVHGMYHDRSPTDPWYTTMSTADPADPTQWTVRRDKLMIEQPGIDVCDPSYIEVNGEGLIAVSYDQNKVVQLRGPVLEP
jgi:hypothetical protein